ncbi:MAG: winged helix-turn-helix domain-containing protein [Thermoproteota archaeon]
MRYITLQNRPVSVSEISRELGKDESTVRRHLQRLRMLGLVEEVKLKPLIVKATWKAHIVV